MAPVTVQLIHWKSSAVLALLAALIHPTTSFFLELTNGKSPGRAFISFAIYLGAYLLIGGLFGLRHLWSETIYRVRADESGLSIRTLTKSKLLSWSQIATLEHSQALDGKTLKNCLTLRDAGGQVQARLWRELQEPPELKAGFERLEEFIVQRVGKRAVVTAPLDAAPGKTSFFQATSFRWLGLGSLVLWLPCAFFSWNHPTGGPVVGSLFLGFALLGVFLALCDSRYEADESGVRSQSLFSKRELRWDEIRSAEMPRGALQIRFSNGATWVELPGPTQWKEGGELMLFLQDQFKRRGIPWNPDKEWHWRDAFGSNRNSA